MFCITKFIAFKVFKHDYMNMPPYLIIDHPIPLSGPLLESELERTDKFEKKSVVQNMKYNPPSPN